MKIHPTAVIDPEAEIGAGCEIGPYCIVGPGVVLGEGCWLHQHVSLNGPARIGRGNKFYAFTSIGQRTQDLKYAGEPTELVIGDGNTIREFCTLNTGTVQDTGVTRIGDRNWIMAYVHVAHDSIVGSDTVLANGVTLAGHSMPISGSSQAMQRSCSGA